MQYNSFNTQQTFFQKLKNFDYILLTCILLLGLISVYQCIQQMVEKFYFIAKVIFQNFNFFFMMIIMSFFNIKFWHYFAYLFYILFYFFSLGFFYGIKASGSQRWINLYFINLQPSELMKIAIIVCLAKYYHRIQINKVNTFQVCLLL